MAPTKVEGYTLAKLLFSGDRFLEIFCEMGPFCEIGTSLSSVLVGTLGNVPVLQNKVPRKVIKKGKGNRIPIILLSWSYI